MFSFLDIETVCRGRVCKYFFELRVLTYKVVSRVCKRWYRITNDDEIWKLRIKEYFRLSNWEIARIRNKKHWFLYNLCLEPYATMVRNMDLKHQLEFAFEETLFIHNIGKFS